MEKDILDKEYIEYYEKRIAEELEDIAISADGGKVEFTNVDHSRRAQRFGRISDGNTTEYANIALEYFGNRCALSGEKFETFELEDSNYKTNLSAEHIVALAIGGHDIAPNIVPSVLQYNLRKNGYYILDYWSKQKDNNGKPIYSPYRLLKVVNYMLKSIEARKSPNAEDIEGYRQAILTPNAIDNLLSQIEVQDLQETDNSKRQILSSTITTTTLDEDNKKILTTVPSIDRDIPDQHEQADRENDYREMIESFISDSIGVIGRELPQVQIPREGRTQVSIEQELQSMFARVVDTIPLEVQIRKIIIDTLEQQGIENVYTITNLYIYNTDILERVRGLFEEQRQEYVTEQITTRIQELSTLLTEEEMTTLVSSEPYILYDEGIVNRMALWQKLDIEAPEVHPRNIDYTLKIVQEYNFEEAIGRKLTHDEERALVQALLSQKILNKGKGKNTAYIAVLKSKLEEVGLTEQEAYGAIINYAIGTGIGNFSNALHGKIKYSPDTKAEIVTTINDNIIKQVTLINNLTDEKILENTEKLKCLGIKTGEIDPKNIDFALTIVSRYDFKEIIGRDLIQDEEKAILQSLISNSVLKKGKGSYISKLQSKLIEAGLTEQETYGAIINYAIGTGNGNYSNALGGALKYDSKNIEAVVTKVSIDTLKELLWKNGMEFPGNTNRLKELGIEIGETSPRNIDLALKIVQEYNFEDALGRKLSQDEERALVQALLNQKRLNKGKGKRTAYIDVLKSKLEEVGLTEQEAYGAIINYAIGTGNGSYSDALGGALKYDSKNIEAVVTKVSRDTLKKLLWKNGMEFPGNTNRLKGLGIVAGKTSPRNVDLALKIVQEYNFEGVLGRKLSEDEEKVLVQALIGNKMLDEGKTIYINTLKSKLQDVGLTEQESYGAIINYAIGTGNGSYSDALAGVLKYSSKTKEEIVTAVTEAMTIQIEKMALKEAVKTDEISDERIAENEERLQDLEVNANQVHPKNIDFALRIIQEYNFEETIGRKLTHDEQKLLVQSLLGLKVLNKSAGCAYISTLQSKLQGMGLTEQEAYGAIINYAIGTGNDNYNHALGGTIKYDSKTSEDIVTQISRDTLKELLWKNGMEVTENTEKIKRLGIDAGEARPQNIDYTLKIVQEYNFEEALGRKLTQDEEKAIIQSLLGPKTLKKHYISVLKNKLQEVGLTEQEAYGTIINYAIGTGIGNFSNALHGKIKYSSENIAEIKKDITEVDVSKAIIKLQGKALKSVKKAVSKETITQIDDTLAAIDSIVVERDGRQKQTV